MLLLGTLRWGDRKGFVKGQRSGTEPSLSSALLSASLGKTRPWVRRKLPFTCATSLPPAQGSLDSLHIQAQGETCTEQGLLAPAGKFWHVSDLHLDRDYKVSEDPLQVCPSAGSQPVPNAGPWGNYLCDSPWILINSSIYAMKEIEPEPDFIFWTG